MASRHMRRTATVLLGLVFAGCGATEEVAQVISAGAVATGNPIAAAVGNAATQVLTESDAPTVVVAPQAQRSATSGDAGNTIQVDTGGNPVYINIGDENTIGIPPPPATEQVVQLPSNETLPASEQDTQLPPPATEQIAQSPPNNSALPTLQNDCLTFSELSRIELVHNATSASEPLKSFAQSQLDRECAQESSK